MISIHPWQIEAADARAMWGWAVLGVTGLLTGHYECGREDASRVGARTPHPHKPHNPVVNGARELLLFGGWLEEETFLRFPPMQVGDAVADLLVDTILDELGGDPDGVADGLGAGAAVADDTTSVDA